MAQEGQMIKRITTKEDVDKLMPLAIEMWGAADCLQSKVPFDELEARNYASYAAGNPETFGLFISTDKEDNVNGFMCGWVAPVWFNSQVKIAYEFGFYVSPEAKGGMTGVRLLKAYEKWAKSVGAEMISINIHAGIDDDGAERLLAGLGYNREGVSVFKEL